MKKIILTAFICLLIPLQAMAQDDYGRMYYVPYLDQYRVDYHYNTLDVWYELVFDAADGTVYRAKYEHKPTGIHYLTCNGTYNMYFYDSSGNTVHTLGPMVTTAIINPTCDSYADGVSGSDDLRARQNGDSIDWNGLPSADKYEIWKDGQKVSETGGTSYKPSGSGGYSIVARDSNGNIVGRSDLNFEKPDGGGPTDPTDPTDPEDPGSGGCGVCEKLEELLECPEWDTYMGELTQAIRNALPTLEGWREIAEQFVNRFAAYFGDVPAPPTVHQINNRIVPGLLPLLDTDVPEVEPELPDDFDNGPIDFDITNGPEIPVEDGSEPIEIYEPDKYINADDPGEMVLPGDPRNHSDGIKQPDTITTPYPNPIPKDTGSDIPPAELPAPADPGGTLPVPGDPGGTQPQPSDPGGIIPIPKGVNP